MLVSLAVTIAWVIYVSLSGQWVRVGNNWQAALTMVFGSFVAGSTPQGSGAIAFPVFTKVLEVPSDVSRTFSLCIQAVGMSTASLAILINRRLVEWRAVIVGCATSMVSFSVALFVIGDPSQPFWASVLPDEYVRVTFTLVLAGMAFVVFLGTRVRIRKVDTALPPMNARLYVALILAGLVGGVASALTGSGADVMLYLFIVVLFGLDPKVGVPSVVLVMTSVAILGLLVLGIGHGQLSVELSDGQTGEVIAVNDRSVVGEEVDGGVVPVFDTETAADDDEEVPAVPSQRFDLFGMWLAAVPFVVWGAPAGSWAASRMKARHLVYFALSLAVLEVVSTAVFVDGLHEPGGLLVYGVVGMTVMIVGLYLLAKYRQRIFGLPGVPLSETLQRGSLDVVPGYEEQLATRAEQLEEQAEQLRDLRPEDLLGGGPVATGPQGPSEEAAPRDDPSGESAEPEGPSGDDAPQDDPSGESAEPEGPSGEATLQDDPSGEAAPQDDPSGEDAAAALESDRPEDDDRTDR